MIQLQFVRQADIESSAIAWFTQGELSHVDAVMPDGSLLGARSDRVGGEPSGVYIRPCDYANFALRIGFTIKATKVQEAKFYAFLKSQIGKPYDKTAIWGFVIGRDWRDKDSWICSELQAAALEAAGIVPPLYLAANKITPTALALTASAIGATRLKDAA